MSDFQFVDQETKKLIARKDFIEENRHEGYIVFRHTDLGIEDCSKQVHKAFGYEYKAEFLDLKGVEPLIPPSIREKHVKHLEHWFKNPGAIAMAGRELAGWTKQGREVKIRLSVKPYDEEHFIKEGLSPAKKVIDKLIIVYVSFSKDYEK